MNNLSQDETRNLTELNERPKPIKQEFGGSISDALKRLRDKNQQVFDTSTQKAET